MRKKTKIKSDEDLPLTIREHIDEARSRIIRSVIVVVAFSLVAFFYNQELVSLITRPLGSSLTYLSPTSGVELALTVSIYTGVLFALPFINFQLLAFILPSLNKSKWTAMKLILVSTLLCAMGLVFGLVIALPASLMFLSKFGAQNAQVLISSREYISFVKLYTVGFALVFQFPFFVVFLNKVFKINEGKLLSYEFYLLPGAFLVAGIITPTFDIVNQALIALPIVVLYQITIIILWIESKKFWKRK